MALYPDYFLGEERSEKSGKKKLSAKMIFEQIRWEEHVNYEGRDFKLSNDFHSRYARLWMNRNNKPGAFRTRETTQETQDRRFKESMDCLVEGAS